MKLAYTHLILFVTMSFIDVTAQKNDLTGAKLNDIQVIGSHNSYKIGIEKPMFKFVGI
jgi:hypothetical protein